MNGLEMTLPLLGPVRELVHEYIGRLPASLLQRCVANDRPPNASIAGWSIAPAKYGGPKSISAIRVQHFNSRCPIRGVTRCVGRRVRIPREES
jgi:hypothetical protein